MPGRDPLEQTPLRQAAERARQQTFFLASSLLAYANAERLDDVELAARLGCSLDQLPVLLLCRRPTGEGAMFRKDVEAIAQRFGVEAVLLARLIRSGDTVVTVQGAPGEVSDQLLAAARDRTEADEADDGEHDR